MAKIHRIRYDIGLFPPIWPTAEGFFGENDLNYNEAYESWRPCTRVCVKCDILQTFDKSSRHEYTHIIFTPTTTTGKYTPWCLCMYVAVYKCFRQVWHVSSIWQELETSLYFRDMTHAIYETWLMPYTRHDSLQVFSSSVTFVKYLTRARDMNLRHPLCEQLLTLNPQPSTLNPKP